MNGGPVPVGGGSATSTEVAIGHLLDATGSVRLLYVAPILLGFVMLFDSWDSVAIAYTMPSLVAEWHLRPLAMGMLLSSGYAGQFVGALMLGALAERIGRMPVFLVSMTLMSLFGMGCALSPNYEILLVLRFLQGTMIGGALPVSITYINELAPTRIRGRYFGAFQFICMAGYAAAGQSSAFVIPHLGWRWMFGLGASPVVLLPLVAMLLPESPRWLARRGSFDSANRALTKLRVGSVPVPVAAASIDSQPRSSLKSKSSKLAAVFAPEYRKRTIIIVALWFFTNFATFGLTTWVPSIYARHFHIPTADALRYAAISSVLYLVASPIAGAMMDYTGRRPLGLGVSLLSSIALLTLAFHIPDSRTLLIFLVVTGAVSISIGTLTLWPYSAENYPTAVRAVGLGVASSTARGASMLTPLVIGTILANGGSVSVVFGVLGLSALSTFMLWLTATRETAGKSLDEL